MAARRSRWAMVARCRRASISAACRRRFSIHKVPARAPTARPMPSPNGAERPRPAASSARRRKSGDADSPATTDATRRHTPRNTPDGSRGPSRERFAGPPELKIADRVPTVAEEREDCWRRWGRGCPTRPAGWSRTTSRMAVPSRPPPAEMLTREPAMHSLSRRTPMIGPGMTANFIDLTSPGLDAQCVTRDPNWRPSRIAVPGGTDGDAGSPLSA